MLAARRSMVVRTAIWAPLASMKFAALNIDADWNISGLLFRKEKLLP
jgi:hypothetical protein